MARITAHETKEIEQERWVEWCGIFTNGNHGRPISIELVGDTIGAEPLVYGIAFVAIDYDTPGKGDDFVISYGTDEDPSHHTVEKPVSLWQGQDVNGQVVALEIEDETGRHTIITLE